MRKTLVFLSLLSLLAFASCGGGNNDDLSLPSGGGGEAAGSVPLTATLKGKIAFEGPAPVAKKIVTSSDPGCKNAALVDEAVVVSDGGLENVIIYVSGGLEGKSFPAPKEPVEINQTGCHYVPHALTIQTNQPLKVVNSDDTAHNIHAWAEKNDPFNESQSGKGQETTKTFTKEEVLLPIQCDVHKWMSAFVGVFTHPAHTTSKKGGAYEMKLPAGKYEITAIHEKYGKQTQMVEVMDGGSADLNFTFKANDKAAN